MTELTELEHMQRAMSEVSLAQSDMSLMYDAKSCMGFAHEKMPPEMRVNYYNRILNRMSVITAHVNASLKEALEEGDAYMSSRFNVIVAGSRTFTDYNLLAKTLDELFCVKFPDAILCGEAVGADTLGKRYASERHIDVLSFPANWYRYGRQAGYIRNAVMLEHADCLVAFWDGESKGTKHMIDISRKKGISVHVTRFNKEETS